MDLKGFVADHMGHFTLYDVPNAAFAMLVAALMGLVMGRVGLRSGAFAARSTALWAGLMTLAIVFVRAQLPLAVALVALVLLVRPQVTGPSERLPLVLAVLIGLGCGSGATLIVAALFLPVLLLVRWATASDHRAAQ
jgi:hypothetical protein